MVLSSRHDFIRALRREPVTRRPVWLMRQAGRYLPEYRALRQHAGGFLDLLKNPDNACEVTLQPVRRFDLDAAILFADILTIPDAMGLGLEFVAGRGPLFRRSISRLTEARALPVPDPQTDLAYVLDTVKIVTQELDGRLPLIGFAGGPWTLAAYMLEGGGGAREFPRARAVVNAQPELVEVLAAKLVPATIAYLLAQARAGAEALMLFESWAGLLAPEGFRRHVLAPLEEIVTVVKADPAAQDKPMILFAKGAGQHAAALGGLGAEALGVDWTVSLADVRRATNNHVALQGNLDPAALLAPEDALRAAVRAVIADFGPGPGHVFNLGHGVTPDVDPERVGALVDEVHGAPV
ncbi:MAG: uroporphyrinogen decarboxylase [Gammaproteobacteria bacterium]|nr:uroporphyrinogen decarboxylase [Gammaproteobacteria bacterium]